MKLDMCMCCTRFIVSVETEREGAHAHKMTMTCVGLSVISRRSWESPWIWRGPGGVGGREEGRGAVQVLYMQRLRHLMTDRQPTSNTLFLSFKKRKRKKRYFILHCQLRKLRVAIPG